jgi:hypothetical protein
MGQYQQWLHHREVDEQLGKRLDQLQTELALLQAQAHTLTETTSSSSDNMIIQALLSAHNAEVANNQFSAQTALPQQLFIDESREETATPHNILKPQAAEEEVTTAPVSPALLAWSRLPNLDAQKMQLPAASTHRSGALSGEKGLLPQDMTTFFHQHTRPVPRPNIPAWLENVISAPIAPDQLPNNPVDQQTLRTNRLVERWLERWRKTSSGSQEQREDQEHESHRK